MEVEGHTKEDAAMLHEDLNKLFADKKFDSFRALLTRGKKNNNKKFDKIDSEAFEQATKDLTGDDLLAAETVAGQINSKDEHVVDYFSPGFTNSGTMSENGYRVFNEYMISKNGVNPYGEGIKDGKVFEKAFKFGQNIPTKNGSYTIIYNGFNLQPGGRAVTVGHEVFGHGPAWNQAFQDNNINAVRVENLFLRIMGLSDKQTQGVQHFIKSDVMAKETPKYLYKVKK